MLDRISTFLRTYDVNTHPGAVSVLDHLSEPGTSLSNTDQMVCGLRGLGQGRGEDLLVRGDRLVLRD